MPRRPAVNSRLRGYEFIDCRDQRHHRVRIGAYRFRDNGTRYTAIEYECTVCGRTDTAFVDDQGVTVHRRSTYPAGYIFKYEPDEPRVNLASVRNAVLHNATVYPDRDSMLANRRA